MKSNLLPLLILTLAISIAAHAENVIQNGDFSLGNTNFSSDYLFIPYDYDNSNLTTKVTGGDYTVAPYVPPSFSDWSPFHTVNGGSSQMLIVNGAASKSKIVWSQNVSVMSNTTYSISFYLAEIGTPTSVATNAIYVGGNWIGNAVAPSTKDSWIQFSFTWNSGSNTNVLLAFEDLNISSLYNDFAIDNINMSAILPLPLTIIQAGTNVILTWPTNSTGFILQSTTNLAPPVIWVTNSQAPVVVSTNNLVTNSMSGTFKFFRLSQ